MVTETFRGTDGCILKYPISEIAPSYRWVDWLKSYYPDLDTNFLQAGLIMSWFTAGRNHIVNRVRSLGVKFDVPYVGVSEGGNTSVAYATRPNVMYWERSALEQMSNIDFSAHIQVNSMDGAVVFSGTIPNLVILRGVEEGHHAAFFQNTRMRLAPLEPIGVRLDVYDAQDIEFTALKWQLRCAKELAIPPRTCQILRERVAAARRIRDGVGKIAQ